MRKNVLFIITVLVAFITQAQEQQEIESNPAPATESSDAAATPLEQFSKKSKKPKKDKDERPPATAYKIIDFKHDTTYVDTSLTIQKDYNFNYLRRDDFGQQPLNNVGQSYNSLEKVEPYTQLMPLFGARARHFNFIEAEDIRYYHVPTPLTELYFKTTFEQGQQLDAFFTINTSPRLNLSIAYKGNRSLGKYKHALTSTGNFRATASYHTKNDRYRMRSHFVAQDLLNEENGGLSFTPSDEIDILEEDELTTGIEQYLATGEDDQERFADRSVIAVNFEDGENILRGKRFYIDHYYQILKPTDSFASQLAIGHVMDITDKSYRFSQVSANELFGAAYETSGLRDRVALEDFTNHLYLQYQHPWVGSFKVLGGLTDYNYGYDTILSQVNPATGETTDIVNRLKGGTSFVGGTFSKRYKGLEIAADGMAIIAGNLEGEYWNATLRYDLNNDYGVSLGVHAQSVAPNYNFQLYQSDYVNYNWQNDFKNIETQKVQVALKAKKWANLQASYSQIDNYTYFTKTAGFDTAIGDSLTAPRQHTERINLLKVKLASTVNVLKWLGLDTTILYQDVSEGDVVYKVPELTTRSSLYYQDYWFRKALFLQAGATLKYHSAYVADGYDPVLSEFYVQSPSEQAFFEEQGHVFGGYPQVDIFFNAKIRQTRIYFKVENFGEAFRQNREFSAPGYAPRDAVIRFGLVWNFFL